MIYTLNDLRKSYIHLYGDDKREDINNTIDQAQIIARQTGEDVFNVTESMLDDMLN